MTYLDWLIVFSYIIFVISLGVIFKNRAGRSTENFFLSNRSFPWWMLGVSMVATTFAADTPLVVAGIVRSQGLSGNWVWWNMAIGWVISVYFFAKLWRRSGILTDAEFISIRYSGKAALRLRQFYALYNGIIINILVSSWVIHAMAQIVQVILKIENTIAVVFSLLIIAAFYSVLSGFWGVVITDLIQFIIAFAGAVILAYYSINKAGGLGAMQEFFYGKELISFWPDFGNQAILLSFISYFAVQWWAQREASMPGYFAQRMFAARTDGDARNSALLFNILHYAVRPWPWILTALASVMIFNSEMLAQKLSFLAQNQHGEASYALMIEQFLPEGVKGFVFMSLAAAFMSTIDTQANWGSSYLIQDLIRPWMEKKKILDQQELEKKLVAYARVLMASTIFISGIIALQINSILAMWKFIFAFTAGVGPVLLLRWYWSRINAEAEIAALVAGGVITIVLELINPFPESMAYPLQLIISVFGAALVWLPLMFVSEKTEKQVLINFYRKVHAGRHKDAVLAESGWGLRFEKRLGINVLKWLQVAALLAAIFLVLAAFQELFLFDQNLRFVIYLSLSVLFFLFASRDFEEGFKKI